MTRARDVSRLITTPPSIYATDSEASAGYLTLSSASSTYVPQNNAMFAGKNKIINGGFDVWQRGTSFTNTANAGYTADRWLTNVGTGGTIVTSQQSFTPGTAPAAGYEAPFFLRLNRSTTGSATSYFSQRIEDVRTFAGQTITLSFWAKASSAYTFDFGDIYAWRVYGTGGSSSESPGTFGAANITTSWQRFTLTLNMPSVSGKTIGASSYLEITYSFPTSKGTFTIDLWGVQVEAGSVATSFVPSGGGNIQSELALCQRYYEKSYGHSVFPGSNSTDGYVTGVNSSDGNQITGWRYAVTKRSTPSTRIWNVAGTLGSLSDTGENSININNGSWNCYNPNVNGFRSVVGSGGLTANRTYIYQWEASSEL
jgi:hypothetical protein